jgi:hypothetical protein
VSVTGYAYPWDYLDDDAAAPRAAQLGLDVVALAATYHAARVPRPLHPSRRVTEVPYSACYVPIREAAWRGHHLIPRAPSWLDNEDPFLRAQNRLDEQGCVVDAWIVLTHLDDAGAEHPDLVVRNAFGEPYPYALCPQSNAVREYCRTLVEETLQTTNVRGVVLEACGPMGLEHGGVHDKLEFANWRATDEALLSICFCRACQLALGNRGLDAEEVAARVRRGVGTGASSPEAVLVEFAEGVAAHRVSLGATLREDLLDAVRRSNRSAPVTLHASPWRWATGSFPAVGGPETLDGVTTVVANCWDDDAAESEVRGLSDVVHRKQAVGGYLRLDRGWNERTVDTRVRELRSWGAREAHLYHLGLLDAEGLVTAQSVIEAFHSFETGSTDLSSATD